MRALVNPRGLALDFERGRAARLTLPPLPQADARVDLADATVSQFHDDPGPGGRFGLPPARQGLHLPLRSAHRETTARHGSRGSTRATDGYVPQAYDQLAAVFRNGGRDDDAKKVMIAKQVRHRTTLRAAGQAGQLHPWSTRRVWVSDMAPPPRCSSRSSRSAGSSFALAHPDHMTGMRPDRTDARLPTTALFARCRAPVVRASARRPPGRHGGQRSSGTDSACSRLAARSRPCGLPDGEVSASSQAAHWLVLPSGAHGADNAGVVGGRGVQPIGVSTLSRRTASDTNRA